MFGIIGFATTVCVAYVAGEASAVLKFEKISQKVETGEPLTPGELALAKMMFAYHEFEKTQKEFYKRSKEFEEAHSKNFS